MITAALLAFACGKREDSARLLEYFVQESLQQEMNVAVNGVLPSAWDVLAEPAAAYAAEHGFTVEFSQPLEVNDLGEHCAEVIIRAADGCWVAIPFSYSLVYDASAPVVAGVGDHSILCGEGLALRSGVTVSDDCFGPVSLEVDASGVDVQTPGVYTVTYTATDVCGNRTQLSSNVYVYEMDVTEDMLWELVDPLLERLLNDEMTAEEKCRKIYACVQASLYYVSDSDKSDWVRAAYTSLFVNSYGDCFSFFAATRALLKRAGIEFLEIQRQPGLTEDTHYWLMVNIAEPGEDARWYYLDPTELRDDGYRHSGCLLTEAQILAYDAVRPNFYAFDRTGYPAVCTQVITPTPELGIVE